MRQGEEFLANSSRHGILGVKSGGEVALVTVKGDGDVGATSAFVLPLATTI